MTITPNPQAMHEIAQEYARRHLANIDHGDVLDEMLGDERFAHLLTGDEDQDVATLDPIAAEIKDVARSGVLSWPGEQFPQPPRLFTDVDRDTTPYLRVRAFLAAATQTPDTNGMGIASVIDGAGVMHVLTEQDVEDVLDDHGEMQNEIDRLIGELTKGQPQDERDAEIARPKADLDEMTRCRDNALAYAERQHVPIELDDEIDIDGEELVSRIEGELLGSGWDWDDDRTPGLLAKQMVAVVRPHLARLTDQAQKARAALAGAPCAVCYCRGCAQCVSPSPPHKVCFCRKAMRPEATKPVPTTGWVLWDAEGRWIGSTTSPAEDGWRAVSINAAEAEEWQQRGCILDRMDEAGWRAYNVGDLARWQFDPGSRDVWLKAKGGES